MQRKATTIFFLDIEMGAMDGVTMAKKLRKNNDTVQIVFIAGYSDYISEGYEVAALHYLMKSVKEEKLCSVLDRAAEKLSKNEKVLNFEIGGEMVRVPIYQIRYADVCFLYFSHLNTLILILIHYKTVSISCPAISWLVKLMMLSSAVPKLRKLTLPCEIFRLIK